MKASVLFKQYVWLLDTISRAGRITLRDINDRWLRTALSDGIPYSRTTFRRHRQEVEEMFGIVIRCDSENRYYIDDPSLMRTDSVPRWMLSTLTVSNIVSEARGLHDRILLESTAPADDHLRRIVDAMNDNRRLQVDYRRYGSDEPRQWTLEPYCIKLFRRRWYLLGRFPERGYIVLSFDRILSIEPVDETFVLDPAFDAEAFFAEYYGVLTDDRVPLQRIVLRAYGNERYALRDLPLHPSQRVVSEGVERGQLFCIMENGEVRTENGRNADGSSAQQKAESGARQERGRLVRTEESVEQAEEYVDFEVRLRPTTDFLAQILSRGRWVKIISPEDIALQVSAMIQEAAKGYQ